MPTATASPVAAPLPGRFSFIASRQMGLVLLSAVLFEVLFWEQRLGLNGFVFMWLAVGMQLVLWGRPAWGPSPFWVTAGGALLSGVLMALYGSFMAAVAGWVSLALVLAFARLPALRSVGYGLLTSWGNALQVYPALARALRPAVQLNTRSRRSWSVVRLLGAPVLAVVVFHLLFAFANSRYATLTKELTDLLLDAIVNSVKWFFRTFSVAHVLFWLLGVLVAGGVVLRGAGQRYAEREANSPEVLERKRRRGISRFRLPDLRRQHTMALVMFGLLNGLLLLVNAIDINWVWLGWRPATALEMKEFVHEGTYLLIFSILLAMALVLWAFRGNLNFYQPGLRWLRWVATAWVLQNAVLAVSVGLRNYHYIVATGLAYKRIGVCAFLVLTLFGLGTIGLKIWQRRSVYNLVRLNGWAAYAVLLLLATGNWEVWMVRYNLQRSRLHIDLSFNLEMPGRALPALYARRDVLAAPNCTPLLMRRPWHDVSDIDVAPGYAVAKLNATARAWGADYRAQRSWQSWNYASWQAYRTLEKIPVRE